MEILNGFKLCRKGLHQYLINLKTCPECKRESNKKWEQNNKDKKRESDKKSRQKNKEKILNRQKQWAQANKHYIKEKNRQRYQENKEAEKERSKNWYTLNKRRKSIKSREWREKNKERYDQVKRKWREKNSAIINASCRQYQARKNHAVPPWADLEKIKLIYKECNRLTKETNIKHEVDHIYPLQNKYLCGLHVETNLQILTLEENRRKGNRSWPGQLECQKD